MGSTHKRLWPQVMWQPCAQQAGSHTVSQVTDHTLYNTIGLVAGSIRECVYHTTPCTKLLQRDRLEPATLISVQTAHSRLMSAYGLHSHSFRQLCKQPSTLRLGLHSEDMAVTGELIYHN